MTSNDFGSCRFSFSLLITNSSGVGSDAQPANAMQKTKKFGGVFQDQHGRLREANGVYAKTNETVEQLGRTFRRTGGRANDFDKGMRRASGGANILTRSVSSLGAGRGANRGAGILTTSICGI